jgi:hypothetical protein
MRAEEARALGALAGRAMAGMAGFVADVHMAILERSLPGEAAGTTVGAAHRGIAGAVYTGVRGLTRALGVAAGAGYAVTRSAGAPALADSPAGGRALGALSGLYGDLLEREGSALAVPMTLRTAAGAAVFVDVGALAAAFPEATRRLVVFVHGLGQTETRWPDDYASAPASGRRVMALAACLRSTSRGTRLRPITPVAPARKTRMDRR